MINDIEFLETVCERMQQVGLVQSKADFSARMLGKGPSYLTSMSARDRRVPDEVMGYLRQQLEYDHDLASDELSELCRKVRHSEETLRLRRALIEGIAMKPIGDAPTLLRACHRNDRLSTRVVRWLRDHFQ